MIGVQIVVVKIEWNGSLYRSEVFCSWPGPLHWPVSPIDSVNASGTNTSSTMMSLEPVPRRPTTFQTSSIGSSRAGP